MSSTAENSFARSFSWASWAVSRQRSLIRAPPARGRSRSSVRGALASAWSWEREGATKSLAHDVRERERVRGRLEAFGIHGCQRGEVVEDAGELGREARDIGFGEGDARQPGDMEDFFGRERHEDQRKGSREQGTGNSPSSRLKAGSHPRRWLNCPVLRVLGV